MISQLTARLPKLDVTSLTKLETNPVFSGFANLRSAFVFWDDPLYYLFYGDIVSPDSLYSIYAATSPDLENWTQFNDKIVASTSGQWHRDISDFSVIKDGDTYLAMFASRATGRIGVAYGSSLDELTKDTTIRIDGDADEPFVRTPNILKHNGLFYCFYDVRIQNPIGRSGFISYATSEDFLTWTKRGKIIDVSGTVWQNSDVGHPSVVRIRGKWYLFYSGYNGTDQPDSNHEIGYAISSDLETWEVMTPGNESPIIPRNTQAGIDDYFVAYPSAINLGRKVRVFYVSKSITSTYTVCEAETL